MNDDAVQIEIVENDEEFVSSEWRHVRGCSLPDYDSYCPIASVEVYKQPDGSYLESMTNATLQESDFLPTPGFVVIYLGGIEREHTLETAASALHNSLTSLFAACDMQVDRERIRTTVELSGFMKEYRSNYSDVVLIGHGSTDGIQFLDRQGPMGGAELSGLLGADSSENPINIISLCCHSGCAKLAQSLSESKNVTNVIAPNDAFDVRWAVHFVTGYFLHLYISDLNVSDAVEHAAKISGNQPMCIWRDGKLTHECAT